MWNSGFVPNDTIYWTEGMAEWAPIVQLMQSLEPQAIQPVTQVNPPVEVGDGVFKWFCPHCATKVSVDTVLLEQIWQKYHGKISCPSCRQEIEAPQVGANPMPSGSEAAPPREMQAPTQAIEPPSDVQASGACPNCQALVELEQVVCVGCGHNLRTNTSAIPKVKYSILPALRESLRGNIRKFRTTLFLNHLHMPFVAQLRRNGMATYLD